MRHYRFVGLVQATFCRRASGLVDENNVGYGPFSITVKRRGAVGETKKKEAAQTGETGESVMNNIELNTNLNLRLSLASLWHPMQLEECPYQSPEWRLAMVRLYRAILRLHNKTVAVSLEQKPSLGGRDTTTQVQHAARTGKALEGGKSSVEGTKGSSGLVRSEQDDTRASHFVARSLVREVTLMDRFVLKYLLTEAQRDFGNRFVRDEFQRHVDADRVASSIFYQSWYDYVLQLSSGITAREMSEEEKRWLTDEQQEKLYQLKTAFRNFKASQTPSMP